MTPHAEQPPPPPPPPRPTTPRSPAAPQPPTPGRARAGLTRRRQGRVVGGVAAGLAARLGVDPVLIRIAFGVLTFAGGAGVVIYGTLWALLPVDDAPPRSPATLRQAVALGFVLAGVLLLLRAAGVWFGDAVVGPVLLAGVGSAVLWVRSDAPRRSWARLAVGEGAVDHAADTEVSPLRIVVGTVLVAAALAGFVAANEALGAVRELATALLAAAAGIGLLFGPWLWRLVEELGHERRERIRQEERAELAAHLHDSVLQTLVLIQRAGDDPRRVTALARRQERELRNWLYHGPPDSDDTPTLASAVRRTAEEVETDHGVDVEVVIVGDADLDTAGRALIAAVREACVNAARHAQVTSVDVYVEVEDDRITAFVRDRGRGFRLADVPADRQGIRSSIIGRLERHGGHAEVHTAPGEGTEVEVTLPRPTRRETNGRDTNGRGTAGRDTAGRGTNEGGAR